MRRQAIWIAVAGLVAFLSGAQAQSDYPSRPVRIIVNSAPGGGTDILARVLTLQLSKGGQNFFVENRGGGGGIGGIGGGRYCRDRGGAQFPGRRLYAPDDAEHRRGVARSDERSALRSVEGFRRHHPS